MTMKKNSLWMMTAILCCGLMMTACVDNTDNPVQPQGPSGPAANETYENEAWMDRNTKPGDNFYEFALGTWLQTAPERDQGYIFGEGEKFTNEVRQYVLTSSDPKAQHLVRNFNDRKRTRGSEVEAMLKVLNIQKPNSAADVLSEINKMRDKGYFPLVSSKTDLLANHEFNILVTYGNMSPTLQRHLALKEKDKAVGFISDVLTEIDLATNLDAIAAMDPTAYVSAVTARAENIYKIESAIYAGTSGQPQELKKVPGLAPVLEMKTTSQIASRRAGEAANFDEASIKAVFNIDEKSYFDDTDAFKNYLKYLRDVVATCEQAKDYQLFYDYLRYQPLSLLMNYLPPVKTTDETPVNTYYAQLTNDFPLLMNQLAKDKLKELSVGAETCKKMMEDMRTIFRQRLQTLDWLSDAGRAKAQNKLDHMTFGIGFPDKMVNKEYTLKDDNTLILDAMELAAQNVALNNSLRFQKTEDLPGYHTLTMWYGQVNAYYDTSANSLMILPVFLTNSIFPVNEEYMRYATSMVFGHEITHGFDSNGVNYDEQGLYNPWLLPDDKLKLEAKQKQLIELYNRLEAYPGQKANGTKTLAENMADYGGIELSYALFKQDMKAKGLSGAEFDHACREYFLHLAKLWQIKLTLEDLKEQYLNDSHSRGTNRVNGIVTLMDEWYQLFDVKDGKLFVEPEKRVKIW